MMMEAAWYMQTIKLIFEGMVEKVRGLWNRKSTDILLTIIGAMFGYAIVIYTMHENQNQLNQQKQDIKLDETIKEFRDLMFKMDDRGAKRDKLLTQIGIQIKLRWGYDIWNEKDDSTWTKLYNEAKKRGEIRGGKSSIIENRELMNNIQYVPENLNIANERAR
jgi:hypothetical protein